jgi:hypothetical protein
VKPSPQAASRLQEAIDHGMTATAFEADDVMGETDCPDGCTVEPDGYCAHGFESAALTLQVI